MYKVFIDHRPIIFLQKEDLSTGNLKLEAKNVKSLDSIQEVLTEVRIDNPLCLTTETPKNEFDRLFQEYLLIEAAGGIVERDGKFLVIKRMGYWDIPKGKIDEGETPEVACVREIMEECGINGHQIASPLTHTYHTMKWDEKKALKKTHWFMLKYDGALETEPQLEEDITEVRWMSKDELLSIRENTFGSINDVLDAFVELKN